MAKKQMQYSRGDLISDGRRMRPTWHAGDGDGDASTHLVERSMNLIRGHPTWKVFTDEVSLPIVRGSDQEPPHYVYLDDRAAYAIWCSTAYTNEELRDFWPWDFDHQGHIKRGRKHRGHPAYLDDSCTEHAQGKLRSKGQWYTFSGAPDVTAYEPVRPAKPTQMEELVAREFAKEGILGFDAKGSHEKPTRGDRGKSLESKVNTHSEHAMGPSQQHSISSRGTPTKDTDTSSESFPNLPLRSDEALLANMFTHSSPPKLTSEILPPRSSSGYLLEAPGTSKRKPGLGNFNPKVVLDKTSSPGQLISDSHTKCASVDPAEYDPPEMSAKKSSRKMRTSNSKKELPFGFDGANDHGEVSNFGSSSTEEPSTMPPARSTISQRNFEFSFETRTPNESLQQDMKINALKMESLKRTVKHNRDELKEKNLQIESYERDLENMKVRMSGLTEERDVYRQVILQFLANRQAQESDLSEHVGASQKLVNSLASISEAVQTVVKSAVEKIAPTSALCEGLGTLLDEPGKFMYDNGMDEEWKQLQKEASTLNDGKGGASQPTDQWRFA